MKKGKVVKTQEDSMCLACSSEGSILYRELVDHLFGSVGTWEIRKCSNKKCGLLWIDPMPSQAELIGHYKNYYTHINPPIDHQSLANRLLGKSVRNYLKKKYRYEYANETLLDRILGLLHLFHLGSRNDADASVMYLEANPGGKVLDIGCGYGNTLLRLRSLGWDVEGLDFDSQAVSCAHAQGLNVAVGDISEKKYPDNYFDAVIMNHVVEHILEPLELLREIYRILKPGGKMVSVTPNANSLGLMIYGPYWRGLEPPRHLYLFTTNSLSTIAAAAKFKQVKCHSIPRARRILMQSHSLKSNGLKKKFKLPAVLLRVCFEFVEYCESILCFFNKDVGEQLILIAQKE